MFVFLIRQVLCICVYTLGRVPLSTRAIVRGVLCVTIDVIVRSLGSSRVCVCICACVRSGASVLVNLYAFTSPGMRLLCKMAFLGLVFMQFDGYGSICCRVIGDDFSSAPACDLRNFDLLWARNCMRI